MRSLIYCLLLSQFVYAAPGVILSPLDHLYVPSGFDSNDSVEVVVTGSFPNPCYSRNEVMVSVQAETITVTVTALSPEQSLKSSSFCPEMTVPFKEVIPLGNLQGGEYQIEVNRELGTRALRDVIYIEEATSGAIDENIYDAVEWIEQKSEKEFLIHAVRFSPCFVFKELKVLSNKKDTLSILPVMKQSSEFCPMKAVPTTYPVKLDFSEMKVKNPLLHVRTLDGKSVNTIVKRGFH